MRPADANDPSAGTKPLCAPKELIAVAERFNTGVDGSGELPKAEPAFTARLFGPGFTIEYPLGHDTLAQAMVSVNEAEIAWPVLSKICRELGCRMQDTESGQIFG